MPNDDDDGDDDDDDEFQDLGAKGDTIDALFTDSRTLKNFFFSLVAESLWSGCKYATCLPCLT